MPTCTCGKTVDDWRGARGHVQFTDDEQHGGEGVPDDWRDLFDDDEPEADESDEEADADDGGDEADPDPSEQPESDNDQSEASESKGGIRRLLTTPLDELLGGGA